MSVDMRMGRGVEGTRAVLRRSRGEGNRPLVTREKHDGASEATRGPAFRSSPRAAVLVSRFDPGPAATKAGIKARRPILVSTRGLS